MLTMIILVVLSFCLIRFVFGSAGSGSGSKGNIKTTSRQIVYTTPGKSTWRLFTDMLAQSHLLIAGCTGSGKSVTINGLINTILQRQPFDKVCSNGPGAQMILIDPKRVELAPYAKMPHTLAHASGLNPSAWISALKKASDIMDSRYAYMERNRLRKYDKSDLYVIIDEWADVYDNGGKDATKLVKRLISEGRAAKVHVIMATQVPTTKVIPSTIRENFDSRLCLRTVNKTQSRVILGESGCEYLPNPVNTGRAEGFYFHGGEIEKYVIPYVSDDEINSNIQWWENQMIQNGLIPGKAAA